MFVQIYIVNIFSFIWANKKINQINQMITKLIADIDGERTYSANLRTFLVTVKNYVQQSNT
jgi:predicted DNA-binding ribbon-helix-helix protein